MTVRLTRPRGRGGRPVVPRRLGQWRQSVPLVTLRGARCPIAALIVKYLCRIRQEDRCRRLVMLIPGVQPPGFWRFVLFSQRGAIVDRVIRRGTAGLMLCWLRCRSGRFARRDAAAAASR